MTELEYLTNHANDETQDIDGKKWPTRLGPPRPYPIEFNDLRKIDKESNLSIPCGYMRYWVDLVPADEGYNEFDVGNACVMGDFELRATIWGCEMINIFKVSRP